MPYHIALNMKRSLLKYFNILLFLWNSLLFSQNYSLSFDGEDNRLDLPIINDVKSLAFWVKISSDQGNDGNDSYIIDARPGLYESWLEPNGTIGPDWSKIYMNGVEIGKVYSISLIDGFAKVSIIIDNTIKIPVDSTITVETNDLFSSKVLSILPGFEEEYMKYNDKFMMAQSSIDALGLLNGYLDIKVKEKKGKQQK